MINQRAGEELARCYTVITTVQERTHAVSMHGANTLAGHLILVGDRKTPPLERSYDPTLYDLLDLDEQLRLPYALVQELPYNHYARKNLGYLRAIQRGAQVIYETDDDNTPLQAAWWWRTRAEEEGRLITSQLRWVNVYNFFCSHNLRDGPIWPRGFPSELALNDPTVRWGSSPRYYNVVVSCGLANGAPDVDAIWRLSHPKQSYTFARRFNLILDPAAGQVCPFNSQNTFWYPEAFPLLYLPATCSMRMTDIWRSFVALRVMAEKNWLLAFRAADVHQDRNQHDLVEDLKQELVGLEHNQEVVSRLFDLEFEPGEEINSMMQRCYKVFIDLGLLEGRELDLLLHWFEDLRIAQNEAYYATM